MRRTMSLHLIFRILCLALLKEKLKTMNPTKISRMPAAKLLVCFDMVTSKKCKLHGTMTTTRYTSDVIAYLKNLKYNIKLSLCNNGEQEGEIMLASCACPAGKGPRGSCKHIAALCYALEEFVRLKCTREFETCTWRLQTWNQPRKRKLDSQWAYEIDFSKKIYRREERNNAKPLNDPRRPFERNNDPKNVNRELLEKIKRVKPNCGFFCLLSDEKLDQNKNDIISPIKAMGS